MGTPVAFAMPALRVSCNLRAVVEVFAPGRVNLIGEHTDYTGGLAMPMAIDLGITVSGQRTEDGYVHLTSDVEVGEAVVSIDVTQAILGDVVPKWSRYVAGVVHELRPAAGFSGALSTSLPVGAGLSSSAALTVAVALALGSGGGGVDLALRCQRAEQLASGVPCGVMDHWTSISGVEDHALLLDFTAMTVEPVRIPLDAAVVVVDSGESHSLIGSAYANRRSACERAAAAIGPLRSATAAAVGAISDPVDRRRARHVVSENERVLAFADALRSGDLATAGGLMMDSHRSLRDDFEVSTAALDSLVERLRAIPGVYGARLTGAGFGGSVVALTAPGALEIGREVRACRGARRREGGRSGCETAKF